MSVSPLGLEGDHKRDLPPREERLTGTFLLHLQTIKTAENLDALVSTVRGACT